MEYRFYFLGADCRVWSRHEFEAETDAAALDVAWDFFNSAKLPHHGFELWEGRRHVHTHNC